MGSVGGVDEREIISSEGGDCGRAGGPVAIFFVTIAGGGIDGGGGRFIRGGRDLSGADSIGEGSPSIAGKGESRPEDGNPSISDPPLDRIDPR